MFRFWRLRFFVCMLCVLILLFEVLVNCICVSFV